MKFYECLSYQIGRTDIMVFDRLNVGEIVKNYFSKLFYSAKIVNSGNYGKLSITNALRCHWLRYPKGIPKYTEPLRQV